MNEKFCILIQISLKFVPKGLIDNKAALVQAMGLLNRQQSITWMNGDLVHWCIYIYIYISLGEDDNEGYGV